MNIVRQRSRKKVLIRFAKFSESCNHEFMNDQTTDQNFWKKCSSCKKPIPFQSTYYVCSVSTCNGERTGYNFCSVACFEVHLPGARHRDAGAIERTSPQSPSVSALRAPQRIIVKQASAAQPSAASANAQPVSREVLVIASRLKDYIQAKSQYNTSAGVMEVLSDHLRIICDRAIENARADGRKTVLDRDFLFLKNR